MGQSGAIRAGKAFVELFADDTKLVRGLRRAQKKLKGFQNGVNAIGAKMLAGSAVIGAALGAMVNHFAKVGDNLDKISQRTGVTVEMLSKLGFAAEQSGADVATLEKGLGAMGRFMVDLESGSKTASDMMGMLGLSMDALDNKTPDERIKLLLKALGGIKDPSIKAGVAMKVLGRAGRQLLPMAENFDALAKKADKFNLTITKQDATRAAELTDSLNLLKNVLSKIVFSVGGALAPMLTEAAGKLSEIAAKAITWVQANKALIVTVAKIVGIVAAVGTAFLALGVAAATLNAIIGLGITLWGLIGTAISVVGTIIGFLLSPIGLVIAGVAALAAYFLDWGSITEKVLGKAGSEWGEFKDRALSSWGGIKDAIAAGDMKLAFRIVVLSLKAEWIRIVGAIKAKWNEWITFFQNIWANAVFGAAKMMTNAWSGLQTFWWNLTDGLADAWSVFTGFVMKTWNSTVGFIAKAWSRLKSLVTGEDRESSDADIDAITDRKNSDVDDKRNERISKRGRERKAGLAAIESGRSGAVEELEAQRIREEKARTDSDNADIAATDRDIAKAKGDLAKAINLAADKRKAKEAADGKDDGEAGDGFRRAQVSKAVKQKSAKASVVGSTSAFDRMDGASVSAEDVAHGDRKKMIQTLKSIEKSTRTSSRQGDRTVPLL
jgi:TP901 family phage tail tape measure protein